MSIRKNLAAMTAIQVAIVLVVGLALTVMGHPQLAASFALGGLAMVFNLFALSWTWWRILAQKPVALTSLIIVFKYALLLGSMFYCVRAPWFNALGAGLGVGSFVFAILGAAILTHKEE